MNKNLLENKGLKNCHDLAVFVDNHCILNRSCVLQQVESDDNSTCVVQACKESHILTRTETRQLFPRMFVMLKNLKSCFILLKIK